MYDLIQSALTVTIEIIAIAGFTGIAAHAVFKQHAKSAAIYTEVPHATAAPQIEPGTEVDTEVDTTLESPDIPPQKEAIADDIWETPVVTSAPRYWVRQPQSIKPTLALCPAKNVEPQTRLQQPEIDLNALDAVALRKLCSQYKIQWRDVRGKNRHATKTMMIFQLNQKAVA
jgi:hypothetical protein